MRVSATRAACEKIPAEANDITRWTYTLKDDTVIGTRLPD